MLRCYSLGSPYGKIACDALAKGANGVHVPEPNAFFREDPIAVWGQLRGAKQLLEASKDFYRLDHAYFGRKKCYRLTRGAFMPPSIVERDGGRWKELREKFHVKPQPQRRDGKTILVCLHRPETYRFFGEPDFAQTIKARIKAQTARPIVLRERESPRSLVDDLGSAHCVVHYASNAAIDALVEGVPVITLGPHITAPVSCRLEDIDGELTMPDLDAFWRHLAYSQFSLTEFESGLAWQVVNGS